MCDQEGDGVGRLWSAASVFGVATCWLWVAVFGMFALAVVLVSPPLGLLVLGIVVVPLMSALLLWLGEEADRALAAVPASPGQGPHSDARGPVVGQVLESGLLSATDLAMPMAGPGASGPWMPVEVTAASPPAVRLLGPDGEAVPLLAETGIVLAGPGSQQAVRHMIAVYAPGVAEAALRVGDGNRIGVYGGEVASLTRLPDVYPIGVARTTIRVLAATGVVSHVVVWRRGSLIAHIAVSGDETLASVLLGHAAQAADSLLGHLVHPLPR